MRCPPRSLTYGLNGAGSAATEGYPVSKGRTQPQKFLAFQPDYGGWNNILMQLEIMAVMAWITGRTLVLPPATRLYLLGDEPLLLEDFVDLDALRRYLPVLTAKEFTVSAENGGDLTTGGAYHDFMKRHGFMPLWNGLENVLLFPSAALQMRPELQARLAGSRQGYRQPVTLSEEAERCEILYFPMIPERRMFGVAECFFMFGSEELERGSRRLLRDAIRYRPEIIKLAEAAVSSTLLGDKIYSAMHVRRGDFQYARTQIEADQIAENTQAWLCPRQPLYVATDEKDKAFLGVLCERYRVITFDDLPQEIVAKVPNHWCGIVETLICAAAPGRFIGTRLSTFSARIAILRGHLSYTRGGDCENIDTLLYYTQPSLHSGSERGALGKPLREPARQSNPAAETRIPWWLSEAPPWARAYEACWAETDA